MATGVNYSVVALLWEHGMRSTPQEEWGTSWTKLNSSDIGHTQNEKRKQNEKRNPDCVCAAATKGVILFYFMKKGDFIFAWRTTDQY